MENKMTPAQFVKDNLPDYNERFCEWVNGKAGIGCMSPESFCDHHFPEALEEFHRKAFMSGYNANHDEVMTLRNDIWREACEAQREECVTHYSKVCGHSDYSATTIRNSPITEPPKNERK